MHALSNALASRGMHVDLVRDLAEMRLAFFQRGGHDALLIGPDVPAALAHSAASSLVALDARIRVLSFATLDGDRPAGHVRSIQLHPSSRAALFTVLREVRA